MPKLNNRPYFKGKTVFIVSLLVIGVTVMTVWLTGIQYHRAITTNFYLALGIIGSILFVFMSYGLYKGVGLKDDFPKYQSYKTGTFMEYDAAGRFKMPDTDMGEGLAGVLLSILLWVVMGIVFLLLLLFLEVLFWFSLFILIMMLYWVFFSALKQVFNKAAQTRRNLFLALAYALGYTLLYTGWLFGIVFLSTIV